MDGRQDVKKIWRPFVDHEGGRLTQSLSESPASFGVRLTWLPPAAVPSVSGDKDIKLGSVWDGTTKLTITAASDFFIAGELREWKGGLSAADEVGPLVRNAGRLTYEARQ